ncbi:GLPGLI family protein [Daejeonella sp.]|uniref:GLPGLI family protein n=1 Tax=Daejeonella sp. TaxID=2805397 RepID=UPI002731951A|nr:GLPGLI family protein [Daejeonella sp.]MDP2414621.1 GLPGLI family protein [Daejeonella sp.]
MKKTIFYTVLLLFSYLFSYAQTSESVIAKANYKLTHHYDTADFNRINTENFIVYLGNSSAHYKSYDRQLQDSAMLSSFQKEGAMAPPAGRRYDDEEIYNYYNEKRMFTSTTTLGKFIVERSFPQIDWKILPEKKQLNGYNCQKAAGSFHGRNYVAWFTAELPFNAGPWKLNGLPGFIIHATDETARILFELSGFHTVQNSVEKTIWDRKERLPITWDDYKKLAKFAQEDPIGFIEQRFGGKVTVSPGAVPKHISPLLPRSYINFPLEAINYYSEY